MGFRTGPVLQAMTQFFYVIFKPHIEDAYIPSFPELYVYLPWVELNRPGLTCKLWRTPNVVQDNSQVPVAKSISKKQESTASASQYGEHRARYELVDVQARQILNIVIFRNDVTVPI